MSLSGYNTGDIHYMYIYNIYVDNCYPKERLRNNNRVNPAEIKTKIKISNSILVSIYCLETKIR